MEAAFLLAQILERHVHDDPAHPTLKTAFSPELVQVPEDFHEAFLQHILRIVAAVGIPQANGEHLVTVVLVQLPLCQPVTIFAPLQDILLKVCHPKFFPKKL
jgi:hypothetical protein